VILRKIIKIVTIGCQILRLNCTKFDFGKLCGRIKEAYFYGKGGRRSEEEGKGKKGGLCLRARG